nr:MAG TPA: Early E1A protein [Caudoviricetes sp.]
MHHLIQGQHKRIVRPVKYDSKVPDLLCGLCY